MCGVSQNAPMLYVFRGLSGVAGGGVTSLTMMIVSDIVSLERRGKYQGILGSMVGVGNVAGPFLAAGFAEKEWRGFFYFICPTAAVCGGVAWWFLPNSMPKGDFKENVKRIDWWGVVTSSVGLILVLIPVSGGGSYFEWKSPMVISMLTIGVLFLVAFVMVEWKVSRLPMIPLSLFRNRPVAAMLIQNFLFGLCIYTQQYMLPLYYQNVRRMTPIHSAEMMIPLTVTQAIMSTNSGQYISRFKRYGEVLWVGFFLFASGTSLCLLFERTTPLWKVGLILGITGLGNGNVFQPVIVALQAHCTKPQRAVVISVRNFLRCLGGSIGLAVSSAILQNVLKKELPKEFSYLADSTYAKPDYSNFSEKDGLAINEAYAKASHTVWIFMSPVACLAFALCIFVRDRGLTRPDEVPEGLQVQEQVGDVEKALPSEEAERPSHEKLDLANASLDSLGKREDKDHIDEEGDGTM
ncbi:hypothetical protein, variant [Verruconis gallopava]|nr:hypothetical protein, variant [Verruconis gallopava]KIW04006.1 hypothetical protein, variant [Verruconis gallopava]